MRFEECELIRFIDQTEVYTMKKTMKRHGQWSKKGFFLKIGSSGIKEI